MVDCSALQRGRPEELADTVREACTRWGFFQVVNHGVDLETVAEFDRQSRLFFELPREEKCSVSRSKDNARGWFDDEYTKRRRDNKEGFDFGMTPCGGDSASVPDSDARHGNLDGFNRFPPEDRLPGFRSAMWKYYAAVTDLADRLSQVMALGMGVNADFFREEFRNGEHTSFIRLNHYPALSAEARARMGADTLGVGPHADAGFLTVLLQDPKCHTLQVYDRSASEWSTVVPAPDAFTINTGNMAEIWSNGKYHSPVHRVLADPDKERFSHPYFYNPRYLTKVAPVADGADKDPAFSPVYWGYFRAQRFAGDFADLGTEIQISDFSLCDPDARVDARVKHQDEFMVDFDPAVPFSTPV